MGDRPLLARQVKDPIEQQVEDGLLASGIVYAKEGDPRNLCNLDFYLPAYNIYIECKGGSTERVVEQLARSHNVILVQGMRSAALIMQLLSSFKP